MATEPGSIVTPTASQWFTYAAIISRASGDTGQIVFTRLRHICATSSVVEACTLVVAAHVFRFHFSASGFIQFRPDFIYVVRWHLPWVTMECERLIANRR